MQTPAASCEASAYVQPHSPTSVTLPFPTTLVSALYRTLLQLHGPIPFDPHSLRDVLNTVLVSEVYLHHPLFRCSINGFTDSGTPLLAIASLAVQTPAQTMAPCCGPPRSCRHRGPDVLVHWNNGKNGWKATTERRMENHGPQMNQER